jgi:hypothetical protein
MSVQSLSSFAKLMLLGALSFWIPDVLWHAATAGKEIPGLVALTIPTVSMPLCLLATYLFLKRRLRSQVDQPIGPPLMLGIWSLGGLFMAVGTSFQGGGFLGPDGFRGGIELALLAILPVYTYVIATYDGSLGALLVASVAAIVIGVRQMRSRRVRPQE